MGTHYYTLTVKTSKNSATAYGINAQCDKDAVGRVLGLLKHFDTFCDRPAFEVLRADGTVVHGIARQDRASALGTST